MSEFLTALALAMVIEGLLYALFPNGMKKAMLHMLAQPLNSVRMMGLLLAAIGVFCVWLIRG